jgi:hypothetical protein
MILDGFNDPIRCGLHKLGEDIEAFSKFGYDFQQQQILHREMGRV